MSQAVAEDTTKISIEEAKLLWEEYKYRHELIWKLIFQITTAVVAILVIPYIKPEITQSVGVWVLALPELAVLLTFVSWRRMKSELDILDRVRAAHRVRQGNIHKIQFARDSHRFTVDVGIYWIGLGLTGLADAFGLVYIWSPHP